MSRTGPDRTERDRTGPESTQRWTGGAKQGGRGLAVVMLENKVDQLESALGVVERAGNVDTSDVRRFFNLIFFTTPL